MATKKDNPRRDRDAINDSVIHGMVRDAKAGEADRLIRLGLDAELAYLSTVFPVEELDRIFRNPLQPEKRESAALAVIDRLAAPHDAPTDYPVECVEELAEIFQHVPEVSELLGSLTDMLGVVDKITVECSSCHKPVPRRTAHLHQEKYIGDECCWDERLRTTE